MAPLGCALVRICRNGKGKNAFLSNFFPVPIFSRSFPRTSLAPTLLWNAKLGDALKVALLGLGKGVYSLPCCSFRLPMCEKMRCIDKSPCFWVHWGWWCIAFTSFNNTGADDAPNVAAPSLGCQIVFHCVCFLVFFCSAYA